MKILMVPILIYYRRMMSLLTMQIMIMTRQITRTTKIPSKKKMWTVLIYCQSKEFGKKSKSTNCFYFIAVFKSPVKKSNLVSKERDSAATGRKKMATAATGVPKLEPPVEEKHYTPQELEMETKMIDFFQMNCDLCLYQFNSWNDARTHYMDKHNILKPFLRCCNRKFFLRSRIIEHVTWHVDPSSFQYVKFTAFFLPKLRFQMIQMGFCLFSFHPVVRNAQKNSMKKERWRHTRCGI